MKIILDHNKTCDNIHQRNMVTKRIYEMKIINNWEMFRRIFKPTEHKDGIWKIKTNSELNNLIM